MNHLSPAEILDKSVSVGIVKAESSFRKLFILGILAGAFIALAGSGANMACFNLVSNPETFGVGKLISGIVFTVGLMLVVLAGGELFTGNCLMLSTVLEKKTSWAKMFRNWGIVYFANLVGAILVAFMVYQSGLLHSDGDLLGAFCVKAATGKVNLSFGSSFFLGIMCNWLVCLAVWIGFGADSTVGKIFGMFFPILLFVTSGYEHSVANMFFIPIGLFAKANDAFVSLSGVAHEALNNLTWSGFFVNNLIPVTLGNIVGGAIFVALAYWYSFKKA